MDTKRFQQLGHLAGFPIDDEWLEGLNKDLVYHRFLYLVAKEIQPEASIELGTNFAHGSAHIAGGFEEGLVVSVDMRPNDRAKSIELAVKNLTLVDGYSTMPKTVERVKAVIGDRKVGLLFIDSNHTYDHAIGEFRAYTSLMEHGGVVLWDDLHAAENDVLKAFMEVECSARIVMDDLHEVGSGSVGFGAMVL